MEKKQIVREGKVIGEMVKKDGKWQVVKEGNDKFEYYDIFAYKNRVRKYFDYRIDMARKGDDIIDLFDESEVSNRIQNIGFAELGNSFWVVIKIKPEFYSDYGKRKETQDLFEKYEGKFGVDMFRVNTDINSKDAYDLEFRIKQ